MGEGGGMEVFEGPAGEKGRRVGFGMRVSMAEEPETVVEMNDNRCGKEDRKIETERDEEEEESIFRAKAKRRASNYFGMAYYSDFEMDYTLYITS